MSQSFVHVSQYFHLPIVEASIKLKMETKDIQRIIKENGIKRWPYSYKQQVSIRKKKNEGNPTLVFNTRKNEILFQNTENKVQRIQIKNLLN